MLSWRIFSSSAMRSWVSARAWLISFSVICGRDKFSRSRFNFLLTCAWKFLHDFIKLLRHRQILLFLSVDSDARQIVHQIRYQLLVETFFTFSSFITSHEQDCLPLWISFFCILLCTNCLQEVKVNVDNSFIKVDRWVARWFHSASVMPKSKH